MSLPNAGDGEPSWVERLHGSDHWLRLEAAIAWARLAGLLESRPEWKGNAGVAWLHASTLFRSYTLAWEQAGAASRWDPDYRREGQDAAARWQALRDGPFGAVEPSWLNALLAGQPRLALEEFQASGEAPEREPPELEAAGRAVLAAYCRAANQDTLARAVLGGRGGG